MESEDKKIDDLGQEDIDKIKQEPIKVEERLLITKINPDKIFLDEEKSEVECSKMEIESKEEDEDYLELEKDNIKSEDSYNNYADINMNLMTMSVALPLTGIALVTIVLKKKK